MFVWARAGGIWDIERVVITAYVYPLDFGWDRGTQISVGLPFTCDLLRGAVGMLAVHEVAADDDAVGREAKNERREQRFGVRCARWMAKADVKVR